MCQNAQLPNIITFKNTYLYSELKIWHFLSNCQSKSVVLNLQVFFHRPKAKFNKTSLKKEIYSWIRLNFGSIVQELAIKSNPYIPYKVPE